MAAQSNSEDASFVPFTTAERIQQLGEIDESIVSLLRTVGAAIQSLNKSDTSDEDVSMNAGGDADSDDDDDEPGKDTAFKHHTNDFLRTLRSVNVRLKRQIWGLEEAGIIRSSDAPAGDTAGDHGNKTLEPDGNGKIGGMDVGWLNSRSNKVERDMESELWDQAEAFLKDVIKKAELAVPEADDKMTW
ncbi:mediator complex, subunit Med11 [Truncatella angustata]|uniref:Mediator of RNA polymerase II transcription subunit 11 n=1 Tax=Truncatella angustata TaxID=152316 RepID=A0A9P8UHP2_9PEZI|nr:mediator complex, subunit Med11 [Truncatella angustata]KAH6652376.1 mediator complex, subunit Med11 [Truncatella angustata]